MSTICWKAQSQFNLNSQGKFRLWTAQIGILRMDIVDHHQPPPWTGSFAARATWRTSGSKMTFCMMPFLWPLRDVCYILYIYIYISTHQTHQPPKGDTGKLIHNPLKSADFFWLDLAKFMWRLSLPLTKQWRLVCLWQVSVHNFLTFIHSCIDSNSQLDFMQQPHSILQYSTRETLTPRT